MLITLRSIFLYPYVMEASSIYIENLCNKVWICYSGILHEIICFEKLTLSHGTYTSKNVLIRIVSITEHRDNKVKTRSWKGHVWLCDIAFQKYALF